MVYIEVKLVEDFYNYINVAHNEIVCFFQSLTRAWVCSDICWLLHELLELHALSCIDDVAAIHNCCDAVVTAK